MATDVKCPVCQLQQRAKELLKDQKVEELAVCAAGPLALMMLPLRLGCGFVRAGSFFILYGLCGVKSFVESACPSASRHSGQDVSRKEP